MTPVVFAWVLSEKNLIRLAGLVGPHEVAEAFAPSRKWQFPEFEREEGISVMAPLQEGNGPVLQDDLGRKSSSDTLVQNPLNLRISASNRARIRTTLRGVVRLAVCSPGLPE